MEAAQVTIAFTNGRVIILQTTDQQAQDIVLDILAVTTPGVPAPQPPSSNGGAEPAAPRKRRKKQSHSPMLDRETVMSLFTRYVRLRHADQVVTAPGASERTATENNLSHGAVVKRMVAETGHTYGVIANIGNGKSYVRWTGAAPWPERWDQNRHAFRYCNREVQADGTTALTSQAVKFAKAAQRSFDRSRVNLGREAQ